MLGVATLSVAELLGLDATVRNHQHSPHPCSTSVHAVPSGVHHHPAYDTVPSAVFVYPQSWEREDTARQSPANWYELVPYMASSMHDPQAAHAGARPRTSAGRVRVKLDWVPPPGTSSVSDLNTTAELNVDANTVDSRPQSVGRAGTPLTMGPTTTHLTTQGGQSQPVKEDVVGMAQYAAAVE